MVSTIGNTGVGMAAHGMIETSTCHHMHIRSQDVSQACDETRCMPHRRIAWLLHAVKASTHVYRCVSTITIDVCIVIHVGNDSTSSSCWIQRYRRRTGARARDGTGCIYMHMHMHDCMDK